MYTYLGTGTVPHECSAHARTVVKIAIIKNIVQVRGHNITQKYIKYSTGINILFIVFFIINSTFHSLIKRSQFNARRTHVFFVVFSSLDTV